MKKTTFANRIIIICIVIGLIITWAVLRDYHRLDTVVPAGVVTALLGMWGGELLIIALRQIFGSDLLTKMQTTATKSETNDNYMEDGI